MPAANHILGLKEGKRRYVDVVSALSKAYSLCGTLDEAKAYKEEIAFFQAVKAVIQKANKGPGNRKDPGKAIKQVIEELIAMAKEFAEAAKHGEELGLNFDELAFYDALAQNESALREMGDETLKKIAQELTQKLRNSVSVDWQKRESVRAKMRNMIRIILRRYKYPPDKQLEAIKLVMQQAEALSDEWSSEPSKLYVLNNINHQELLAAEEKPKYQK